MPVRRQREHWSAWAVLTVVSAGFFVLVLLVDAYTFGDLKPTGAPATGDWFILATSGPLLLTGGVGCVALVASFVWDVVQERFARGCKHDRQTQGNVRGGSDGRDD